MAELSYDGVRQAAQTAVNQLQSTLNDLRSNLQNIRLDQTRANDIPVRVANLERVLNDMFIMLQRVDANIASSQSSQPLVNSMQQSTQSLQNLDQRVANIEQLAADMTHYLNELQEQMTKLTELHQQVFGAPEP